MFIALSIAKKHLRVDGEEEDSLIGLYITAAQEQIEQHLQFKIEEDLEAELPKGSIRVNAAIQAAGLLFVGHLYENREATSVNGELELPLGYWSLIQPYRLMGV